MTRAPGLFSENGEFVSRGPRPCQFRSWSSRWTWAEPTFPKGRRPKESHEGQDWREGRQTRGESLRELHLRPQAVVGPSGGPGMPEQHHQGLRFHDEYPEVVFP